MGSGMIMRLRFLIPYPINEHIDKFLITEKLINLSQNIINDI